MQIIVVSGFLGSGKTTFLLQVIRFLTAHGKTFAVIVNEIGEVGIDNQHLKQVGANVWEVLGGCICCSSVAGLERALDEVIRGYQPDYILVEPSGIADPANIKEIFNQHDFPGYFTLKSLAMVDSDRIELLKKAVYPLLSSGIEISESVLVTKTDVASADHIEAAVNLVKEINPKAEITSLSLKDPLPDSLLAGLL